MNTSNPWRRGLKTADELVSWCSLPVLLWPPRERWQKIKRTENKQEEEEHCLCTLGGLNNQLQCIRLSGPLSGKLKCLGLINTTFTTFLLWNKRVSKKEPWSNRNHLTSVSLRIINLDGHHIVYQITVYSSIFPSQSMEEKVTPYSKCSS
jgi:hypothetical protein